MHHRLQDITINPDNIFNTECEQEYSVRARLAHCAVGLINGYLDMGSKQKSTLTLSLPRVKDIREEI